MNKDGKIAFVSCWVNIFENVTNCSELQQADDGKL